MKLLIFSFEFAYYFSDLSKIYEPQEAIKILKEKSFVKFNETVDVSINLGIDTNKTDQNIKGVINLPKGSGKKIKIAVVCEDAKSQTAKDSGSDIVGVPASDIIEIISPFLMWLISI